MLDPKIKEAEKASLQHWFEEATRLRKELESQPTQYNQCCADPHPILSNTELPHDYEFEKLVVVSDDQVRRKFRSNVYGYIMDYHVVTFTCENCGTHWRPTTIGVNHYNRR